MEGLEHVEPERWLAAEPQLSPVAVPAGCKGAACPFFAACQGRCAKKNEARARRAERRLDLIGLDPR